MSTLRFSTQLIKLAISFFENKQILTRVMKKNILKARENSNLSSINIFSYLLMTAKETIIDDQKARTYRYYFLFC